MRAPLRFIAAVAVLFVVSGSLAAQGTVRGKVTDAAGSPLAHALLTLVGAAQQATTNALGDYELRGVPAGTYTLRVRVFGYVPQSASVTVGIGVVTQDFKLASQPIGLSPVDVVVGSRARHTAAEELAVPVDVFTAEDMQQQGASETSQILQALSPSVNFPHQSVTDATDIVRPFTLRGLSPDHTLVLLNGLRRHQTAVVNTFAYGTGAGSSGVDLNAIPASAIDRIEVLRDGASAQYGSDAIAGVVNLVVKEGPFTPFMNVTTGRYIPRDYPDDGTTADVNTGWGIALGRGSLSLFGEFLDRQPTNRAWADPFEDAGTGLTDSINAKGQVVVKRNPVPQPNHHWGDGLEKDVLTLANLRMPLSDARTSELYAFGGYSTRHGNGQGYRRCAADCASFIQGRNWPEIYPLGYLPEFSPDAVDYSAAAGFRATTNGWSVDLGAAFGHNDFEYNLRNTLNISLGPCLDPANPCAPGPDSTLGNGDDIPLANQMAFFAGRLTREEMSLGANAAKSLDLGMSAPVNVAVGVAFRRESFQIEQGDSASWIDGGHRAQDSTDGRGGSQVFAGFSPNDASDNHRTNFGAYADLETNLSPKVLANVAARFEHYSDFGSQITGKAAFRFRPSQRITLRAAGSTGFRAPGIGQSHFSKIVTNVIGGVVTDVGVFPVADSAARLLGAKPLKDETAVNLSAGLAWSPRDNITITADVYHIAIKDRILLGATFDDSVTLAILSAGGFSTIGGIQYFTNGLDTKTQGLDLTGNVRLPAGNGTLNLSGAINYTKNEITRVDPLPTVLDTNSATTETGIIDTVTYIGITEERPDVRATFTGQYTRGGLHGLARLSYYGKFSSAQPGFCDLCRERYGAKSLVDVELGYRFSQVNVSFGIRNLFDTYPDQPSSQVIVDAFSDRSMDFNNNFGTFPWAAASPFGYNGRYLYARVDMLLGQ